MRMTFFRDLIRVNRSWSLNRRSPGRGIIEGRGRELSIDCRRKEVVVVSAVLGSIACGAIHLIRSDHHWHSSGMDREVSISQYESIWAIVVIAAIRLLVIRSVIAGISVIGHRRLHLTINTGIGH
jgi:hypothetical protein